MMSVEPGIVDANVLAYATNADVPNHAASRALLDAARDPSVTLYVTSQILCEFYSVITNPRRVAAPSSSAEALRIISALSVFAGHPYSAKPGQRCDSIDRIVAASSGNRRRGFRFTDCRDHAGKQRSEDLHL
jgi:predicted nucleic acid-binding protein